MLRRLWISLQITGHRFHEAGCFFINQSINQSANQSTNQSINQSFSESISEIYGLMVGPFSQNPTQNVAFYRFSYVSQATLHSWLFLHCMPLNRQVWPLLSPDMFYLQLVLGSLHPSCPPGRVIYPTELGPCIHLWHRNFMEISRDFMRFHWISWDFMEISWDFMRYPYLPA